MVLKKFLWQATPALTEEPLTETQWQDLQKLFGICCI